MHSKNGKFLYFLRSRIPGKLPPLLVLLCWLPAGFTVTQCVPVLPVGLPPTPVQLLYPVSRFSSVKTLQHLCRFCIRQLVRIDHIQELPLPRSDRLSLA